MLTAPQALPPRHPFADGWYLHTSLADLQERLRPLVPAKLLAAVAERLYARRVDPGAERALFAQVAALATAAGTRPPAGPRLGGLPAPRPGERTLALAWPQDVGPDEVARWLRKYAPTPAQVQPVCHVLQQLADPTTTPARLQAIELPRPKGRSLWVCCPEREGDTPYGPHGLQAVRSDRGASFTPGLKAGDP
jgi:hypothetical protein